MAKPIFNPHDVPPFMGFPKEALTFLSGLKKHNNKVWFDKHKEEYENFVKAPMQEFIAAMALEFHQWAPDAIADPKRSMFRIYRDIRFSKDKTPYKTHVAAWFPLKQLKLSGGFYVHVSGEEMMLGGGIWQPPSEYIRPMRAKIAEQHVAFRKIVEDKGVKAMFGGLEMDDMLKKVPAGYPADHPAAEYLKLKSYLLGASKPATFATKKDFLPFVVKAYKTMLPFVRFLNL